MIAFYLMNASKKGISARTSSTARLASPIRPRGSCAIASAKPCAMVAFARWAATASIVEADETYFGKTEEAARLQNSAGGVRTSSGQQGPRTTALSSSLVERGGNVRSFHVAVAERRRCSDRDAKISHRETPAAYRRKPPLFRRRISNLRLMKR